MTKGKQGRRRFIKGAGLMAGSVFSSSFLPSAAIAQSGQTAATTGSKGAQIRSLLAKSEMIVAPIVPDIVSVRLCEMEGFQAVQIGDSQPTTWHGYPGYGLVSYTEVLNFSRGQEALVPSRQRDDNARSGESRKGECDCLSR